MKTIVYYLIVRPALVFATIYMPIPITNANAQ